MYPERDRLISMTRRHFFGRGAAGIGMAALAGLLDDDACAENLPVPATHGAPRTPRRTPRRIHVDPCALAAWPSSATTALRRFAPLQPNQTGFGCRQR